MSVQNLLLTMLLTKALLVLTDTFSCFGALLFHNDHLGTGSHA